MPKESTHLHFAEGILKGFLQKQISGIDRSAYLLGSIFPDVFFYLKPYKYISERTHGVKGNASNEILLKFLKSARENSDINLYSFALGHISHYSLDICMHPHINRWVLTKAIKKSKRYYYFHILIETALDYKIKGIHPYPITRAVVRENSTLIEQVAGILNIKKSAILSAYTINIHSNKIFRIPFIRNISGLFPKEILYGGLFYSNLARDLEFDFLLFQKEMKHAALFCEEKMAYALKYWQGDIEFETLKKGIPDINLEEGLLYNPEKLNENGIT